MRPRALLRRRCGSLALFFCLVVSAALMYAAILLQAALIRADEYALTRAMSAQVQTSLANFNVELRQFGLFGFAAGTPDLAVFYSTLPAGYPTDGCEASLCPIQPVSNLMVLQPQIIRYMKARVPVVLAEALFSRLKGFQKLFDDSPSYTVSQDQASAGLASATASGGIRGIIHSLVGDLPTNGIRDAARSIFGDYLDDLEEQAIHQIEVAYRQYAAEWLGTSEQSTLQSLFGPTPDLLDPTSLEWLAGKVETLLTFRTSPVYNKFCLTEYVLGQFRPAVQTMASPSGNQDIQTLDGRSFASMPSTRQAEVEMILTGLNNPDSAKQTVKALTIGLRGLIHLADILCNERQMEPLRATATAVSAAIVALTSGAVCIDPQIILYLLVAGKAISAGLDDFRKLEGGQAVALLPGWAQSPELYYQDYLRLYLLVVPSQSLLTRVASRLNSLVPSCYTGVEVTAVFRHTTYRLAGGYH